jgi:hypothetical protein
MDSKAFFDGVFGMQKPVQAAEIAQTQDYAKELFVQHVGPLHDEAYIAAGALLSAGNTWSVVRVDGGEPEFHEVTTGLLAVGDEHLNVGEHGHIQFPAVDVTLFGTQKSGSLKDRLAHSALPWKTNTYRKVPRNWHPGIGMGLPLLVRSYDVTNYPSPADPKGWTKITERVQDSVILGKAINVGTPEEMAQASLLYRGLDCYVRPNKIFSTNGLPTGVLLAQRSDRMQPTVQTHNLPQDPAQAAAELASRTGRRCEEAAANLEVMRGIGSAALMPARRLVKNGKLRKWWNEQSQLAADRLPVPDTQDSGMPGKALMAYYSRIGLPID